MDFRRNFYIQPLNTVFWEMLGIYAIWTAVMLCLNNKHKQLAARVCLPFAVLLVLVFTVIGRESGAREISVIPLISFINAKAQPEMYRSMFMNMLLFMPLGLSLPYALPKRVRLKALAALLAGALLSAGVEAVQFFFSIGRCETDDVIMNTLGTAIGSTSYLLHNAIQRVRKK